MPSSTSATSTKSVMTRAVKNSPIAAAATIAMLMDSSMVIRRAAMFSAASLKIGQPPTVTPRTPRTLTLASGSHRRNPHRRRGQGDERDAGSLRPREGMLAVMLIVVIVVVVRLGCRDGCAHLALLGDAQAHGRIFKDSHWEFLHFR